ncbi:CBS domain-containing protein [Roseospira goensis]|uniref:CBS domain-containing protein n=1 Tax=Roseospira goensis TaxID=391922 RepID=A0A7W6S106_9PROT|nr:CBS domain-containing protein [Roseospira goensis]MBB4286227.1 CBS domain-containing protein [Roseospira goensis]
MKRLKEVMSKGIETVAPTTSLRDAARRMDRLSVGMLPVDESGTLIGTLTDRDIVVHAVAEGVDVNNTRVRQAMTAGVTVADEDDSVADAAAMMAESQVRRLLVTNSQKEVVGTVSLRDLAMHVTDPVPVAEAVRGVSAH